jgi:hypothetical protein
MQRHRFVLDIRLCHQVAFLDLEYRTNVARKDPNSIRIARYLGLVRKDLLEELQAKDTFGTPWQPDSTRPWAVRALHSFGHSQFGRDLYLTRCQEMGWEPYAHDKPLEYGT